jgi:hypothetical protein
LLNRAVPIAFAILAVIAFTGSLILTYKLVGYLSDPATSIDSLLTLSQVTNWFTPTAMWSSKIPILILYIKLFGVKVWLRWLCWGLIVLTSILFTAGAGYTCGMCDNRGRAFTPEFLFQCSNASSRSGVALGTVAIVTDIFIFIIPLPIIASLKLPTRRKWALALVFITGFFGIVASGISTYYKYSSLNGSSVGLTNSMITTLVECAIAIIVGCVPAIAGLWARLVKTGGFFSRLSASFSRGMTSKSSRTQDSEWSRVGAQRLRGSTDKLHGSVPSQWGDDHSFTRSTDRTVIIPLPDIESRGQRHE